MSTQKRILMVEDQMSLRLLISAALDLAGYDVIELARGADVVKVTQERGPDLILLDVGLPDLDGYTVCRQLKADPDLHKIMVILVTGKLEPADRAAGIAAGADDILGKPFSPTHLVDAVGRWLHQADRSGHTEATPPLPGGMVPRAGELGVRL
ncbi:MAG: response regulator [Chloroflexota bacterium]